VSVPGAQPKRAVSWIFDVTIMVAGGLVGLVALGDLLFGGQPRHAVDAGPAHRRTDRRPDEPVPARAQPLLQRHRGGLRLRVLVFLVCFHGGAGALGIWAVGQALSQVNRTKRTDVRMFNVGLGILSGFVAVAVMRWVGDLGTAPCAS
jgi:hypothetical protein